MTYGLKQRSFRLADIGLTLLLGSLSACSSVAPQKPLIPEAPAHWSSKSTAVTPAQQNWLADYSDPELAVLVELAMKHNFDLASAAARVDAAHAVAELSSASLWPTLDADFSGSRARSNPGGSKLVGNNFDLGGRISWELDVWNRLENAETAAYADANAVKADYRGAQLLIASEVARTWFNAIESHLQVRLAEDTAENFASSLEIIESRYRRGLNTALEVRLARENLASALSVVATRKREKDLSIRQLDVLLGSYPAGKLKLADQLPRLNNAVPAGLPAELLQRRPDLVAARLRLAASDARLLAALDNRLPTFILTGNGGTASSQLHELLDWDNLIWSLFGGLVQPLFDGGGREALQNQASAQQRELQSLYSKSLLNAFREVETGLAAEVFLAQQEIAIAKASSEARAASTLALQRYQLGLVDIVTLLEAQRRAFNAESSRLLTMRQRLTNRVELYLALGGGLQLKD